jgi:hypothetical protein
VSTTGRRIHTNVPTHSTFEPDLAISAMKPPQPCGPGQATHRRRRAPLACRAVAHRQAPRPPLPSLVASCTSPGCLTSKPSVGDAATTHHYQDSPFAGR